MIRQLALLAAVFCCTMTLSPLVRAAEDAASQRFTIPDVCSIGTPGKGWAWKAVSEYDSEKGGTYVCSAEGKPGRIILNIDVRKIEKDSDRIVTLKMDFNSLHEELGKMGCTDVKGKRPNITPPIGQDVDYLVYGKTPKGPSVYFAAHTIFKDHTFLVQAVAPSLEQAQKLGDVAKTLK